MATYAANIDVPNAPDVIIAIASSVACNCIIKHVLIV